MSDRPTELDTALDAFDEAFKQAVTHLAAIADVEEMRAAYSRAKRAREACTQIAKELSK